MPETFDLDRAFDDLARDVAARSHPAGADRAVTTARRRRTSLGAVAAVAVLSVGGLVVSQLGGGSPAPQPGGPPGNVTVAPEPTRPPARDRSTLTPQRGLRRLGRVDAEWRVGCAQPVLPGPDPAGPGLRRARTTSRGPGVGAAFTNARYASAAAAGRPSTRSSTTSRAASG